MSINDKHQKCLQKLIKQDYTCEIPLNIFFHVIFTYVSTFVKEKGHHFQKRQSLFSHENDNVALLIISVKMSPNMGNPSLT